MAYNQVMSHLASKQLITSTGSSSLFASQFMSSGLRQPATMPCAMIDGAMFGFWHLKDPHCDVHTHDDLGRSRATPTYCSPLGHAKCCVPEAQVIHGTQICHPW